MPVSRVGIPFDPMMRKQSDSVDRMLLLTFLFADTNSADNRLMTHVITLSLFLRYNIYVTPAPTQQRNLFSVNSRTS